MNLRPYLSRSRRIDWDRCTDRRFVGFALFEEYGRVFCWRAWRATRPKSRDMVLILARKTNAGTWRTSWLDGHLAYTTRTTVRHPSLSTEGT